MVAADHPRTRGRDMALGEQELYTCYQWTN